MTFKHYYFCIPMLFFHDKIVFAQETLLQVKHKVEYVILRNDTAFVEYFIIDKPNRYVGYDTLMLNNGKAEYTGKKTTLQIHQGQYKLHFDDSEKVEKDVVAIPATPEQIKKWNRLHNSLLYNAYAPVVRKQRERLTNEGKYGMIKALDIDWALLFSKIHQLSKSSFEKEFLLFKGKYLMAEGRRLAD